MFKNKLKKIIYGYKATSETYIDHLKRVGVDVGENVRIFCPHDTTIELQNPFLIKIGNDVMITGPVTILTHDYSVSVINKISGGKLYGKQQPVTIGDNVFIGWGTTILSGTTIGSNVIIGAGAVVSGNIEDNYVYAGNPLKKICTISEYLERRETKQLDEAVQLFNSYLRRYNSEPDMGLFHEYFYLFSDGENLPELFKSKMIENRNYEECENYLREHRPRFASFEEFKQYALQKGQEK